jgi:hypothetical protein
MSAPLLWIVVPGAAAVVLYLLRHWTRLTVFLGAAIALALGLLAWRLTIGDVIPLLPGAIKLEDTLTVLGRRFVLTNADRPLLLLSYLTAAFWFGGTLAARPGRMAVPLGLAAIALLTAALAVDPFLYAASLIGVAALVCVPILAPPGQPVGRGVVRFVTFQLLGLPFILFTGWMLTGVEATPGDQTLILRVGILLGFGFGFLLAVFPFHTWIPMLAEESHPYAAVFVFLILTEWVATFGLGFLDRYSWLRSAPLLFTVLRWAGTVMIAAGGLWAAFQHHLGRLLGYAVMVEIGFALLAVGLPGGLALHYALLLPRILGLGAWAVALSILRAWSPDLHYRSVRGLARRLPVTAAGLIVAHFSTAGLPLLAGFPLRLAVLETLSGQSLALSAWTLVGMVGLFFSGARTLAVLLLPPEDWPWQVNEHWTQIVWLVGGMTALLIVGLFPQWFLPWFASLAQIFEHLGP